MKTTYAAVFISYLIGYLLVDQGRFSQACNQHDHSHDHQPDSSGEIVDETTPSTETEASLSHRFLRRNTTVVREIGEGVSGAFNNLFSRKSSSRTIVNQTRYVFNWDDDDSPLRIGDMEWASVGDFKRRGARCSVKDRTPEEKRKNDDIVRKFLASSADAIATNSSGGLRKLQNVVPINVPVYFTVITSGPLGIVTREQIDQQIAVLNAAYRPWFLFTLGM
jgi:hypothetical protein